MNLCGERISNATTRLPIIPCLLDQQKMWLDPTLEERVVEDFGLSYWLSIDENEYFILQQFQGHLSATSSSSVHSNSSFSSTSSLPLQGIPLSHSQPLTRGATFDDISSLIVDKNSSSRPSVLDGKPESGSPNLHSENSKTGKRLIPPLIQHSSSLSSIQTPKLFRILLRAGKKRRVVAEAELLGEIVQNWEYIQTNLLSQIEMLHDESPQEEEERFKFLLFKLTSLAKSEEVKPPVSPRRSSSYAHLYGSQRFFEEAFNLRYKEEDRISKTRRRVKRARKPKFVPLIASYPSKLWRRSNYYSGRIYLSRDNCCYYMETKENAEEGRIVMKFVDIAQVLKDDSKGLVKGGIRIVNVEDEELLFTGLEDRDAVYDILIMLWTNCMRRLLGKIEGSPATKPVCCSSFCKNDKLLYRYDLLPADLISEYKRMKFVEQFSLPQSENLKICTPSHLTFGLLTDIGGYICMSENFICFANNFPNPYIANTLKRTCDDDPHGVIRLVLPFRDISKVSSIGEDGCAIHINNKLFIISKSDVTQTILKIWTEKWQVMEVEQHPMHGSSSTGSIIRLSVEKQKFFQSIISDLDSRQNKRWIKYMKNYGFGLDFVQTKKMKRLVLKGLPCRYRGSLWFNWAGGKYKKQVNPHEYQKTLLEIEGISTSVTEDIDRDLHRSLPEHPFFQKAEGIKVLRRVLTAYAFRNPAIGYCQSMNIVCALLVLFMPEEEAYWTLSSLCEDILKDYYSPSMIGSTTDQQVLQTLLEQHLPDISMKFHSVGVPLTLVTFPWLLCLFIGAFDWEVTIRVLDLFFFERSSAVLLRISLTAILLSSEWLSLSNDAVEFVEICKNIKVDPNYLMKSQNKLFLFLTPEFVQDLQLEHRCMVIRELLERDESKRHSNLLQLGKSRSHDNLHKYSQKPNSAGAKKNESDANRKLLTASMDNLMLPPKEFSAKDHGKIPTVSASNTTNTNKTPTTPKPKASFLDMVLDAVLTLPSPRSGQSKPVTVAHDKPLASPRSASLGEDADHRPTDISVPSQSNQSKRLLRVTSSSLPFLSPPPSHPPPTPSQIHPQMFQSAPCTRSTRLPKDSDEVLIMCKSIPVPESHSSPVSPVESPRNGSQSPRSPIQSPRSPIQSPRSPIQSPRSAIQSPRSPIESPPSSARSSTRSPSKASDEENDTSDSNEEEDSKLTAEDIDTKQEGERIVRKLTNKRLDDPRRKNFARRISHKDLSKRMKDSPSLNAYRSSKKIEINVNQQFKFQQLDFQSLEASNLFS